MLCRHAGQCGCMRRHDITHPGRMPLLSGLNLSGTDTALHHSCTLESRGNGDRVPSSAKQISMLIPVILSGGRGTLLWPLSRQNLPKQFLPLAGDSTLFQQTVVRATVTVSAWLSRRTSHPNTISCAQMIWANSPPPR